MAAGQVRGLFPTGRPAPAGAPASPTNPFEEMMADTRRDPSHGPVPARDQKPRARYLELIFILAGALALLVAVAAVAALVGRSTGGRPVAAEVLAGPFGTERAADVQLREWYTATELGGDALIQQRIGLTSEDRKAGMCFLVVEARISATAFGLNRATPRASDVQLAFFKLHLPNGATLTADGSRTTAIGMKPDEGLTLQHFQSGIGLLAPSADRFDATQPVDFGAFFVVRQAVADRGQLRFQFKDLPSIPLTPDKRHSGRK